MTAIKTEKGIALPPPKRPRFPFKTLEMGESFFVPCEPLQLRAMQSILSSRATWWGKRLSRSYRTAQREEDGQTGVRTWRVS